MVHGFIVENWKLKLARHPVEDAYSIDKRNQIIAVADGVTRDPMEYLPDLSTLKGKVKFAMRYPKVSPAKISADLFTQTFPQVLRDFDVGNRDENAIRESFVEANRKIGEWNKKHISNPDYVMNDFAGCVAAGTTGNLGVISYGFLTDAGVAKFDSQGNLAFRTENQGPDKHDEHIWKDEKLQNIEWANPEARRIVRREYRNNPSEEHSFGVLTGESDAMEYVRTGTQEIKPGEHLIVYTDGLESTIFSPQFSDLLRKNDTKGIEKLCKGNVKTEGTLIHHCETSGVTNGISDYER